MSEKLKPCPFCGGEAEYERFNNPKTWFTVRCSRCGCQTDGFCINHDDATAAENKAAMYIIIRLSVGAYIIGNRKRHPVRRGISSKQSVIETMEEEA